MPDVVPLAASSPVRIAVAGLGGYAHHIGELIRVEGPKGSPPLQMVAACDPDLARHGQRVEALRAHGVEVFDDFEAMIAMPGLEAVWLPVPINLHLPFALKALERDLHVMLEKPVVATIDEFDQLVAARDAADRVVAVGFQDVYDATTLPLKRRLQAGEFGKVERVSLRACWPRPQSYFTRASWAGKLRDRGAWVLDSPVNNATAHFINIVLFLLGPDDASAATPTRVEAELYRAASIENYDTASLRVRLASGVDFLVLLTHATDVNDGPHIVFHTQRGEIHWSNKQIELKMEGRREVIRRDGTLRTSMLRRFAAAVRGVAQPDTALSTLESARPHTLIVNGASQAAPVVPIEAEHRVAVGADEHVIHSIAGIDRVFRRCAESGQMLHESGELPFTRPARSLDLTGYNCFAGPPSGAPAAT